VSSTQDKPKGKLSDGTRAAEDVSGASVGAAIGAAVSTAAGLLVLPAFVAIVPFGTLIGAGAGLLFKELSRRSRLNAGDTADKSDSSAPLAR
jgi:hypothetical protein